MAQHSRPRLHAGHAILLLLGVIVLILTWRLWSNPPVPPMPMPPLAAPVVADPALLARSDPFFPDAATEAMAVTSLPFTLHGVRTDSVSGRGSAIVAGADGQQSAYAVGDDLGNGVTLVAVAIDHVVLDNGGRREMLWLDVSGPGDGAIAPASDGGVDSATFSEPPPPEGLPPPAEQRQAGAADVPAAPDPEGPNP